MSDFRSGASRRGPRPTAARASALALVLVCGARAVAQEPASTQHVALIPVDKGIPAATLARLRERGTQRVYTGTARRTIGMPCGGIGCGQLYVLGDGTLGQFDIDGLHRFSGYGSDNYRTFTPPRPIAQGFALAVTTADGACAETTLDDAGYDALEFVGEYPVARIRYRAQDQPVPPVRVDLEVFSPFIPLNARASAYPATVLRFTVTNSSKQPAEIALGGWLENMVCREALTALTIHRRNRCVRGNGLTSVHMDVVERRPPDWPQKPVTRVLYDFESGTYAGWTVTGEAFRDKPATGALPQQNPVTGFQGQYLVNSFGDGDAPTGKMVSDALIIDQPYLTFRIAGGGHKDQTCVNLVVDGAVAHSATGGYDEKLELHAWDVSALNGRSAYLEIVDEHSGAWGHINVDEIALTNALPPELAEYNAKAANFGDVALSFIGDGIASARWDGEERFLQALGDDQETAIEAEAETAAKSIFAGTAPGLVGTLTSRFSLEPAEARDVTFLVSWYFPNLHTQHRQMYTNWFGDALEVARELAANLDHLRQQTRLFCDTYYRETTLPWWLATRLMMPVSTLATGTCQWWDTGRFWAWEGVGCCSGTCTHVWNYAQAHAWLFPELARSVRSMQDLCDAFDDQTGLVGFRSDRNYAADGQAGTVLKCYREHLFSPDMQFLKLHWPRIKLALAYLIEQDGNGDGIIDNSQHNTYDINFVGPNTFVGSLYLAALLAGERMALLMDEPQTARRYRELFEAGKAWTASNLFNGEYFEQRIPPDASTDWQYGRGCLSDQVFGQNWAHALGLEYVYPPDQVRSALASVLKYNWAPDIGPYNAAYEPERWFVNKGDGGLFICTWPGGGRPETPVRYRDEVWTGIEYQVAAGLIWEGLVDEALMLLRAVDDRYDGVTHNPWNEVECGDHYARALASWGVLHALAGYTHDGPAGRIGMAPRIQPENFACFFSSTSGWGTLSQRRAEHEQTNAIELKWGTLSLSEFVVGLPEEVRVPQPPAAVLKAGQASSRLEARVHSQGRRQTVQFVEPVTLTASHRLEVTLRW